MAHIAFIGLGNMGAPMATNLARAGEEVRGFDLATVQRDNALKQGVPVASSAREAFDGADFLITMLPAGKHVMSVWRELLPYAKKGMLFVDCSTIDVESARKAHELANSGGILSVDAPVSGGVAAAKAATLTFMCGANETAFNAARPILEKMGKRIIHCGAAGLGQAAKICNNMILAATMIATSEAFVLGEKLGLSHQALYNAASVSSAQSWSLTTYCPVPGPVPTSPANAHYKPGFMTALMLKDLRLSQTAAGAAGVATPLGAAATQLYALYDSLGNSETDFSGIVNMLRGDVRSTER